MTNELLPVKRSIIPEVVDETGRKITGPEMEAVTGLVTQLAQLAQLARIRKSLEREHVEGKVRPLTLSATDELNYLDLKDNWPYIPWATAYFYNDGPDYSVFISINNPYEWYEVKNAEDYSVDLLKADRRIEIVYYKCDSKETASVRAVGKY